LLSQASNMRAELPTDKRCRDTSDQCSLQDPLVLLLHAESVVQHTTVTTTNTITMTMTMTTRTTTTVITARRCRDTSDQCSLRESVVLCREDNGNVNNGSKQSDTACHMDYTWQMSYCSKCYKFLMKPVWESLNLICMISI